MTLLERPRTIPEDECHFTCRKLLFGLVGPDFNFRASLNVCINSALVYIGNYTSSAKESVFPHNRG